MSLLTVVTWAHCIRKLCFHCAIKKRASGRRKWTRIGRFVFGQWLNSARHPRSVYPDLTSLLHIHSFVSLLQFKTRFRNQDKSRKSGVGKYYFLFIYFYPAMFLSLPLASSSFPFVTLSGLKPWKCFILPPPANGPWRRRVKWVERVSHPSSVLCVKLLLLVQSRVEPLLTERWRQSCSSSPLSSTPTHRALHIHAHSNSTEQSVLSTFSGLPLCCSPA